MEVRESRVVSRELYVETERWIVYVMIKLHPGCVGVTKKNWT